MDDPAMTETISHSSSDAPLPGDLADQEVWLRRLIAEGSFHYVYTSYESQVPPTSHKYIWPVVMRELQRHFRGVHVLDAGCGNGTFCREMAKVPGWKISGVDLSQSGIEIARKICPQATFKIASINDEIESIFGHRFDAIVSIEVIPYMYDPRGFIEAHRDGLRDGGLLIMTAPYHGFLKNLAISMANRWDRHFASDQDGGCIKFWSRRTLSSLLEECGFRVIQFNGCGRIPYFWKSMVITAIRD